MISLAELESRIAAAGEDARAPGRSACDLLGAGEAILEHWITARGELPTRAEREGFRLLALQRQGARGEPSFNACRETCRELAWHYNLITAEPDHADTVQRLRLMGMVAMHLYLFVSGKLEVEGLGDFCCSSRPLHGASA